MNDDKIEQYYIDHEYYINLLKTDPLSLYETFKTRIDKFGINAEFPEFASAVYKVRRMLHSAEVDEKCASNKYYNTLRNNLDIAFLNITLTDSWYPYATTIHVLYNAIMFFDLIERCDKNINTGFYHSFRYLYHFDKILFSAPKCFIFPTWFELGATDILKMSGCGIYIAGLNFKTEYVDEFLQTPGEFFIHDINHIRRYAEANERRYNEFINDHSQITYSEFYAIQRDCIDKIIKLITSTSIKLEIRQAMRIIFFEILHEEAEPPLESVICKLLTRESSENYATGFKDFVSKDSVIDKKALATPSGSIIGFVRYKLWYGFYDDVTTPNYKIATLEARKVETIAEAARLILERVCNNTQYTIEHLKSLTIDNQGLNLPVHDNIFKVQNDKYYDEIKEDPKSFTGIRPETLDKTEIDFSNIPYMNNKIDLSVAKPLNSKYTNGGYKRRAKKQVMKQNLLEYNLSKYYSRKCLTIDCKRKQNKRKN